MAISSDDFVRAYFSLPRRPLQVHERNAVYVVLQALRRVAPQRRCSQDVRRMR